MAADIYNKPLEVIQAAGKSSAWRQMGKAVILGCGFGMGAAKFVQTVAKDGVYLDESEGQRIIDLYRSKNPNVVALWRQMERAALNAVQNPGQKFYAANGRVVFAVRDDYLRILLPSRQRTLAFYKPHIVERMTPWGQKKPQVRFWGEVGPARQWLPVSLYGGLIVENVVQAIARDLMAHSMFVAEDAGYAVVLSVHDELLTESPIGHGNYKELERLMTLQEPWADGCPIAAEGWTGPAYRK